MFKDISYVRISIIALSTGLVENKENPPRMAFGVLPLKKKST